MSKYIEQKYHLRKILNRAWERMLETNRAESEHKKNKELEDLESEEEDLIHG